MNSFEAVTWPNRRPRHAARALARAVSIALIGAAGVAHAQSAGGGAPASTGAVIYPAKGQSAKEQDKDKYECYAWAKGQTGFDPTQQQATGAPAGPTSATTGSPAGMVKGAAGGAAVAELADRNAGKGAATGALGALMRERAKQQQAMQAGQQQAAQQQAQRGQQRSTYERAFGACLEGRGYVVK